MLPTLGRPFLASTVELDLLLLILGVVFENEDKVGERTGVPDRERWPLGYPS
jgi:hypothetical protein